MKLLIIPLAVLITCALLAQTGLGQSGSFGTISIMAPDHGLISGEIIYYDSAGQPKVYGNFTKISEPGEVRAGIDGGAYWVNGTTTILGTTLKMFQLYYDTEAQQPCKFQDITQYTGTNFFGQPSTIAEDQENSWFGNISTSLGLIILIVGLMALVAIIGINVLGSGESEFSVKAIFLGTGLLALWGIFSAFGINLIAEIDFWGPVVYLILTAIYTLGIIQQISGVSGGD